MKTTSCLDPKHSMLARIAGVLLAAAGLWTGLPARAQIAPLSDGAAGSLGEALDTVGLSWTTGSKPWLGQTVVTHDGVDAAQSATNLTCDDHSWLKTTVAGPGTVSFRWKAQIDGPESFMAFYVAGGSGVWPEAAQLHETTDWQWVIGSFGSGEHDLFWVTYGNCADYSRQITGWLDEVVVSGPGREMPPYLTAQPASQTVVAGTAVTFQCAAAGYPFPTYQWQRNGAALPGATNATLPIANAQPRDWGDYVVAASNRLGAVMSNPARLQLWPLMVWGTPNYGTTVLPPSLAGVRAVAAGAAHALIVRNDGTVAMWGSNPWGPVPAGLSNVVAASAGTGFSVALKGDGTVAAWGWGWDGETNVPPDLNEVVAVDCGGAHTIALRRDGTVVTWGYNPDGRLNAPRELCQVVAVSAGGAHNLALRADRTVVGWGWNDYGQADVPPDITNVVAVAAGGDFSVVLKADGTVRAWGGYYYGQDTPPGGLSNVVAVAAGHDHALALRADGTVIGWGNDFMRAVTIPPGLDNVIGLAAGGEFEEEWSLGLRGDGSPVITVQPIGRRVTTGDAVTLTAFAVGQPPLRYQWLFNGQPIAAANQPSLVLPAVQPADGGRYAVSVSNRLGAAVSREAVLNITAPVSILRPPGNQIVFVGQTAQFTVAAAGTPPLSFQWRVNGSPIPGATNDTLRLPDAQPAQAGTYSVVIADALGHVTSAVATLEVRAQFQPGVSLAWMTNMPGAGTCVLHVDRWGNAYVASPSRVVKHAPDGSRLWAVPFDRPGGGQGGMGWPTALTVNEAGHVFVTGYTSRESADYDWTTIKLDADGSLLWRAIFGSVNSHDTASAIGVDAAGSVYVTGSEDENSGHAFLVTLKYDSAGNLTWAARYRGDYDAAYGRGLAIDGEGNVVVIGTANSWRTYFDWAVVKYDRDGHELWATNFGSSEGDDQPQALALNVEGDAFVTGMTRAPGGYQCTTVKFNSAGQTIWVARDTDPWTSSDGGQAVALDPWGNVCITATGPADDAEERRGVATVEYDPEGGLLWASRFFGTHHGGRGFAVDRTGNVYVTAALGPLAAQAQPVTIKYDPNGHPLWIAPFPLDGHWGELSMLGLDRAGGVYVAGVVYEEASGYQCLLVKYAQEPQAPTLAGALDATNLAWTTGGAAPWVGQTAVTYDGMDAAGTRLTEEETQSWLETTVQGPGHLTFFWKTYCNGDFDLYRLLVDGQELAVIWAEYDMPWQPRSFEIPAGVHTLRWVYEAHAPQAAHYGAWLDQVSYGGGGTTPSLAEALDATNLTWTTGGDAPWVGQTAVTDDGIDAAQSGPVADFQESWMETRVTLVAPGSVSFWWKVSSGAGDFGLAFYTNGVMAGANIDGEVDWTPRSVALPSGEHVLRWTFHNAAFGDEGLTAGWVDQVFITGMTSAPYLTKQPESLTRFAGQDATFFVEAGGVSPLTYQWQKDGVALAGQTNATLLLASVQASDGGRYRAVVSSPYGTTTSSEAILTVLPGAGDPGCAGRVDPTFDAGRGHWPPLWPPWAPTPITSVTVQADGKVVIAGGFSEVQGVPSVGVARLDATGLIDANYVANPADVVSHQRAVQADAKVLAIIPGDFGNSGWLVRYLPDGTTLDSSYAPALPPGFNARAVLLQPDGKALVAGGVYTQDAVTYEQSVRSPVVRLLADGSADAGFVTNVTLSLLPGEGAEAVVAVYDIVQQADGRIYLGGFFTAVNGARRTDVTRLRADGTLDSSFEPDIQVRTGADSSDVETVSALGLAPDGRLVIAGFLHQLNGLERWAVARLHTSHDCGAPIPLAEALDWPAAWTTDANGGWFGQTNVTHDGVDAAQCGVICCEWTSRLVTHVTGPARVSFWWEIQSGPAFAALSLWSPEVWITREIRGDTDWQHEVVDLPAGQFTLSWEAYFENTQPGGTNGAWVDQVEITPLAESCVAAPAGLVSWWRGEGNSADEVGGNTGALHGAVDFAAGNVGQAFAFDGSSYVEVPDAPALRLTNELTIEFWVRREQSDQPHYIVEKGGDWTWGEQNYAVALHTAAYNNNLHFLFGGGWRGGGSIADTNWHHCAVTARDGDTDPALYLDGVPQSIVYREGADTIRLNPSPRPLHIGAQIDPQSGWFYYHQGLVDELSLYNRALSAAEIEAIYRAGSAGKCRPPLSSFVTRQISGPQVQLVTAPPAGTSVYAVEDQPPAGWPVTNISHGGVFDAATGKVKFGPFYDHEPRTLSYEVLAPVWGLHCALGVFCFSGQASADGVNSPIAGQECMALAGYFPADVNPADRRIRIEEVTSYGAAWRRGSPWECHAEDIPIDYVTRAAFLWRGGECYTVEASVTNEPLWWVNCDSEGSADFQSAGSQVSNLPAAQRETASAFVPGEPLVITVSVSPAAARAYAVEEQFPAGWTVSSVSDGGEVDAVHSQVKWGPFLDNTPRTLSYQAIPPATASDTVSLAGVASFDGTSQTTTGPRQLVEGCRVGVVAATRPGQFQLTLSGRPGVRLLIEASSDLVHWTALGAVTTGPAPVPFVDPDAAQFPQRFYRAREER